MSGVVLALAVWSALQRLLGDTSESAPVRALLITVAIGGSLGAALWMGARRARGDIGRREAILLVATSWFVAAAIGAMPYRFWAALSVETDAALPFGSFVNCYFEAMSGLTTTGATVLRDIESVPRSLLLWRAVTHWLGGLGIVVLFVAVLPLLGVGGKHLFRVEAPGPSVEGVKPRIQEAARVLWVIYVCLTAVEIIALRLAGMNWFDSVCHTFATLATGGFSTHNASVGGYDSVAVDVIIIAFMVAAGINFGLYYQIVHGGWRTALRDTELRCYLGLLLLASIFVIISIHGRPLVTTTGVETAATVGDAVRHGTFTVVALQTTTGFCTADFNLWGTATKVLLVALMFVGGSAGSTGGGIKVMRCLMAFKIIWAELEHVFRPRAVRVVKVGRASIDTDMKVSTLVYVLSIGLLTVIGAVVLMLLEQDKSIDVTTAITAAAATLNNIGPGLNQVGAVENYAWFSDASKCFMSVLMALGRLEVFTIIVLLSPRFWKSD